MSLFLSSLLLPEAPLREDEDDEDNQAEGTGDGDAAYPDDFFHTRCFLLKPTAKVGIMHKKDFPLGVNTLRGKEKYAERKICTLRGKFKVRFLRFLTIG